MPNDLILDRGKIPSPRNGRKPFPFPPPPPPQNKTIVINMADFNGGSIDNTLISSAIVGLTERVTTIEENLVNGISLSSLQLGETSGTAYPGDKGYANANAISTINAALNIMAENSVTRNDLDESLLEYAKTSNVTANIEDLRNSIPRNCRFSN